MDYNVWTNWDTWLVALLAGNDYDLYQRRVKLMEEMLWSGDDPEEFRDDIIKFHKDVANVACDGGDDVTRQKVNWDELVEVFMDDYADYKERNGE